MSSLPVRRFPQEISIGHGGCLLAHIASDVCSDDGSLVQMKGSAETIVLGGFMLFIW